MEDLVNIWQGRRVFLTGHTGFKGSWLSLWLTKLGAEVCGYSLDPETTPNMFQTANVAAVLKDVRGNIMEKDRLESVMKEFAPSVVFHLAAQPLVRRSYADPLGTYATNVMGTAHLLEAVRNTESVQAVVCVTTDKCYENKEWIWPYRETDPLGGFDPYASSKACAEIVAAAYRSSFFSGLSTSKRPVAVATARGGNVIGGGDWSEDRLIPDLIRGFQSKQPVLIRHPKAIRPWQHVLELLCGYILLAEKLLTNPGEFTSAFNFGPGDDDTWPVDKIATKLSALWGDSAEWKRDTLPSVHEAHYLKLDASKARSELGWRPRLGLAQSLEWIVTWYKANQRGEDMKELSFRQIENYEHL